MGTGRPDRSRIHNPLSYIMPNSRPPTVTGDAASLAHPSRVMEIRHATLEARDGAHRVREIVAEMRTLARGETPSRPISITHVLESVASAIASEIRTRARLVKKLDEVPLVDADEARLGQVFINLLLNAADAIADGQPALNEISIATFVDPAGRVVVEVRDSGIGIHPELHTASSTRSSPASRSGEAWPRPLDLPPHRHGLHGTISVESAPERGSVFRVTLPAAAPVVAVSPSLDRANDS